jgi:hypothetical protein
MQEYVPGENLILLFVQTFGIYDFRLTIYKLITEYSYLNTIFIISL